MRGRILSSVRYRDLDDLRKRLGLSSADPFTGKINSIGRKWGRTNYLPMLSRLAEEGGPYVYPCSAIITV